MSILSELEKAVTKLVSPQNMAAAPQRLAAAQMTSEPGPATTGNLAPFINSTIPGDPRAPMDHVRLASPTPPPFDRSAPPPTAERFELVAAEIQRPVLNLDIVPDIIGKNELATLREMDKRWQNLNEVAAKFTGSAARVAHRAHLDMLTAKIASGDSSVESDDSWSFDDFASDFETKLRTCKGELRKIEMAAAGIARPIRLRFAHAVQQLADHLELGARDRAERFACPFTVPTEVAMLRRMAAELHDPNAATSGKPGSMVSFIKL